MTAAAIPPHVQRMVEERDQLEDRLTKLTAFFDTDTFVGLDEHDRVLMQSQASLMTAYRDILNARIERANG